MTLPTTLQEKITVFSFVVNQQGFMRAHGLDFEPEALVSFDALRKFVSEIIGENGINDGLFNLNKFDSFAQGTTRPFVILPVLYLARNIPKYWALEHFFLKDARIALSQTYQSRQQ